jgi:hypothetical protein
MSKSLGSLSTLAAEITPAPVLLHITNSFGVRPLVAAFVIGLSSPATVKTIYSFKIDKLKICDDF